MKKIKFKVFDLFPAIVLMILVPTIASSQVLEFSDWEKQTFIKQSPDRIMEIAGIEPGMTIGEVGAGYGRITLHLAKRIGESGKIYANDINKRVLDSLLIRCSYAGFKNVKIILGEENDPLFPQSSLDVVIFVWTFHWLEEPIEFMKNLSPSLKPKAKVILVEPDPDRGPGGPENGISRELIKSVAKQSGFKLIHTYTDFPEDLIFVLKRKRKV